MKQVILASISPRRQEIFEELGITFVVEGSEYEEDMSLSLPPRELVLELARGKAEEVARKHQDAIVVGADTIVSFEEKVLGKPKDIEEAREVLRNYSGKTALIITAFVVLDTDSQKSISDVLEAKVFFKEYGEKEIEDYLSSGEAIDKAGSFAVQGKGYILVERTEGDVSTMKGLPKEEVISALREFGVEGLRLKDF